MVLGYGVPLHDLTVTLDIPEESRLFPEELERFPSKAVKDLGAASKKIVLWKAPALPDTETVDAISSEKPITENESEEEHSQTAALFYQC